MGVGSLKEKILNGLFASILLFGKKKSIIDKNGFTVLIFKIASQFLLRYLYR
jgi:hypothetical protein